MSSSIPPRRPAPAEARDSSQATQALSVLQSVLDRQSDALLRGDMDKLSQTMALPYRHGFLNRQTVVETPEDLAADGLAWTELCRALGVNQLILLAVDAEPLGTDHISGHFVCHTLRNAVPMLDTYLSRVVLQRRRDAWRVVELQNFITIYEFPFKVVRVPFAVPERHEAPEDDARRAGMDALSIYQRYLDETRRTVAGDDFDAYCRLHIFPYTAHGATLDNLIEGPEDLRPFYDVLRRCHDGTTGDRIERFADRAEFIGSDMICGYHVGRVFKGAEQTVDDVSSRLILKRLGTEWRLQTVANSISNTAYPFSMYEPGGVLKTHIEIQKRTKS